MSWCVYNYAVIKLIYDEKTRDWVAGNFYHLEKRWIIRDNWKRRLRILIKHTLCADFFWKKKLKHQWNISHMRLLSLVMRRDEKKSNHVNADSDLQYFDANCGVYETETKSMLGNFIDKKTTRNENIHGSLCSPQSHVFCKPSKIVNLFMISLYPSSFSYVRSIVWSSAFVFKVAEIK